jgi:hypothetical protein
MNADKDNKVKLVEYWDCFLYRTSQIINCNNSKSFGTTNWDEVKVEGIYL